MVLYTRLGRLFQTYIFTKYFVFFIYHLPREMCLKFHRKYQMVDLSTSLCICDALFCVLMNLALLYILLN